MIQVLEQRRSFRIADEAELEYERPDPGEDDLAFLTCVRPPMMRTSRSALATPRSELAEMNGVVVIGADLWLPYSRS